MKYDLELILDDDNSLQKIINQIKPNSIVLEFGPANGRMTKYLKEKLNCSVYFVEIDEEAAKDAINYAVDGIVGDIEEYEWMDRWKDIQFDYITFADVLEHLRNPQEVLSKTKRILKSDGEVIISVPNVGHNSILINLYNNIFQYTPLGLLDNTHVHLFAYNTLKEFCFYAGYTPVIEDGVYSAVGGNEVTANYEQVPVELRRLLRERKFSNVYQFVFTLKKKTYTDYNEFTCKNKLRTYFPEYYFKVYFDKGNSWCEENSVVMKTAVKDKIEFSIDLDDYDKIKGIRIDPLDRNCILLIEKIALELNDGTRIDYDWKKLYHTGSCVGDFFVCDNDDPQVIMENVEIQAKGKLIIAVRYMLYEENSNIYQLNEVLKSYINKKEDELSQYRILLHNAEEEKRVLKEQVDYLKKSKRLI